MRIVTLAAALLLALPTISYAASPVHDDFADAIDLNATSAAGEVVEGTNVAATKEASEPDHAGNAGGKSVWYTWTAPGDGSIPQLAIRLFADFDTLLGVYTGASVDTLTELAANDDLGLGASAVSFATTPGTTYRIAIDGFAGKSGRFALLWNEAPVNDNFADAIVLAGAAGSRSGDNSRGGTLEPGEQDPFETGTSVWYSWTPPADGTYKLATVGSRFDTVLAVYEGSSPETLELLRVNDDDPDRGCCSSWVPLVDAQATTTYMIQVTPLGGVGGVLALQWGPLILGTPAGDVLAGTAAGEEIRARGGNDSVRGLGGADLLFGGRGNDTMRGGTGFDFLLDRSGGDSLAGDGGRDRIDVRDGRPNDDSNGGSGIDTCRTDSGDIRHSCEL